ncbi:acyltransferase family protein [Alteromonas portus]|uniref:acyltransferase family protein n=1 Tax=Alteromonas portus TaxID=2565549 RepID=UPI003BF8B7AF
MTFREDIQGLRALAVLSVVIYHISPFHLPGGFIGVDIFFVISGYLIIGQIYKKLLDSNFDLKKFYIKRFQRLFPAFFVTTLVTTIFALFFFLPGEFNNYSKSLISAFLYISNFYFYGKSGYFDTELQNSPLLHTWSLSVEEQFYAIMPGLLLLSYKYLKNKALLMLALIGVISFVLCFYFSQININFAFFSPFTRFWQFIVGGFVAIFIGQNVRQGKSSELLSIFSLVTLVCCFFLMSHDDFPGLKAVIPTFATAILLAFSKSSQFTYKLLTTSPARFFGDISYSLYLWHWPVFIFYSLYFETELTAIHKVSILLVSIFLATISYHTIENNFRNRTKDQIKIFLKVTALSTLMCAVTFLMSLVNTHRFTKQQLEYEKFMQSFNDDYFRKGECFLTTQHPDISFFQIDTCIKTEKGKENIVLIGDSHAAHWYSAMNELIGKDQTLSQITASGCKPLLNTAGEKRCTDLMKWAFDDVLIKGNVDTVILSARWKKKHLDLLIRTIEELQAKKIEVIVLGPIIEYSQPLPRLLALSDDVLDVYSSSKYDKISEIDVEFKSAVSSKIVKYFSVLETACPHRASCITLVDGKPIQFDYGHLTENGARLLLSRTTLFPLH